MLADLRICVPGGCAEWCLAPLVGGSEHVGVARCLAPSAVNGARHAQTRRALVLHRGEPGTYPRSSLAPVIRYGRTMTADGGEWLPNADELLANNAVYATAWMDGHLPVEPQ